MRRPRLTYAIAIALLIPACASPYTGIYTSNIRAMEGREPTNDSGYTLDEVRARVASENRRLELSRDKRFVWNTGSAVNEGTWRVEGNTLYLREDVYNGTPIQPALRKDREWTIKARGELVTGSYSAYNLEEYYVRP